MNPTNSNRPISIKAVAEKLAAAANCEHLEVTEEINAEPRLVEALLFIQHVSQLGNYAGGLNRFAGDLIEASRDLIGTDAMHEAPAGRPLTRSAAREIYERLPNRAKIALGGDDEQAWIADALANRPTTEPRTQLRERVIQHLDRQDFAELCVEAASESLVHYLRRLCEEPNVRFTEPWYFPKVAVALLRFIDHRKAGERARIAETEVTQIVFKWLDRARRMGWGVMITGNSRRGKTQALHAWCAMNPGLARLVNTPASNSEGDLLREVAKAIGLEIGANGGSSRLRDRIDYVLTHTRLMLVFDEAHLLFPVNFNRNTAPARLNWVRRSVMDAGLPCVFCATPQSFHTAQKRFIKTTGYAIEQFTTRLKPVTLPEELSRKDLLAVARIHFPNLAEPYLEYVVENTVATERNYFSDLSNIAALAFCNAEDAGRKVPTLADIKAAIVEILPLRTATEPLPSAEPRRKAAAAEPLKAAGSRIAARSRALIPDASSAARPIHFDSETPEELTVAAGD